MRPLRTLFIAVAAVCLMSWAVQERAMHAAHLQVTHSARAEAALPRQVLWVWERPEDLSQVRPESTAVAVLQETLRLGSTVQTVPRRQPVALPERITQLAVVRIETQSAFAAHRGDANLLAAAVDQLRRVAAQPGVAALQIDFDARRSERTFYRRLLEQLRATMPAGMPLEMTALASWCSNDDWIADLPVSGAVPMFFRMEPDRQRLLASSSATWRVTEPLCSRSVGVSTSEPWPPGVANKRVYLFSDHGWKQDFAWISAGRQEEHP